MMMNMMKNVFNHFDMGVRKMSYPRDYSTLFLKDRIKLIEEDIQLANKCISKYPNCGEYSLLKIQAQNSLSEINSELERRKRVGIE